MDVIKTYLDNVFAPYPKTHEVLRLKQNMLANMEEKFLSLHQSGKSDHEAAYTVIADFGNIEELTAEIGLTASTQNDKISLSQDEIDAYMSHSKIGALVVGFGVWFIIFGISSVFFANNFIMILFAAIAVAVVGFIIIGAKNNQYMSFAEKTIYMDPDTRKELEAERTRRSPIWIGMVALGVAIIIISVGILAATGLNMALFLNIIGLAVCLFIIAGVNTSAYDVLLNKGEYSNKKQMKKAGIIISTVATIYWPSVVGIYLLWSFVFNSWDISWVVWPVAGVLFGAIAGGISVWQAGKEK